MDLISDREILKILAGYGIKARPNVINQIKSQFLAAYHDEAELERLLEKWSKFEILDESHFEEDVPVSLLANTEILVIDLFFPNQKRIYDPALRSFSVSPVPGSFYTPVKGKQDMHINRFLYALDRVKSFNLKDSLSMTNSIDSLIGIRTETIIIGILRKSHSWAIEDLNSRIDLDIKNIQKTDGFFCAGSVVLAQGRNLDGVFKVSCLAHPPVSWLNPFPVESDLKWSIPWTDQGLIVFLSNVHLDEPNVLTALDKLFSGYSQFSSIMFVLIGNFCSQKDPDPYKYPDMFEDLTNLIEKYENLMKYAFWVFVPGPNDPGLGEFLPRQAIPNFFVPSLKKLEKWKCVSNPCKVWYCGKKIMVARVEQLRKMQRNTACPLSEDESKEAEFHLCTTLVRQAHVCPTLHTEIVPDFDYALQIDQKLDFLCVAETSKGFKYEIDGVVSFNPGHFSRYFTFFVLSGSDLEGMLCDLE